MLGLRQQSFFAGIGVAAIVIAGAFADPRQQAQAPSAPAERPKFDAASVKPNKTSDNRNNFQFQPGGHFVATNYTLRTLINIAYAPGQRRTITDPKWDAVLSERFDIVANAASNPPREQNPLLLQTLLEDRFKLMVHYETRPIPIYALVLSTPGKMGPGLKPHSDDIKCIPVGPQQQGFGEFPTPWCGGIRAAPVPGGLRQIGNKATLDALMTILIVNGVDRVVLDRTGLTGTFDYDFQFAFAPAGGAVSQPSVEASDPSTPPSIFTAMQEQLGLKLEPRVEPVYVLVIDHVEEPSEN